MRNKLITMGNKNLARVLDLCPDLTMAKVPGYFNFSMDVATTPSVSPLLCWNSMTMWMMITRMKFIMKNRSQTSAIFSSDDLGRELMREERREANTRKPVMAPMNLQRERNTV